MVSGVASVVFGLLSAATWGAGDFCGGLAAKRASVYGVIIVGDLVGGVLLAALALAVGEPVPGMGDLAWGAAAGVSGVIGLIALYRALASGRMSVASPVAAIVTAALPVLVGAAMEGLPGRWQIAGFGLALLAVWLISGGATAGGIRFAELGLPVVAGLGFGVFFVLIDHATPTAVLWPLVAARLAAVGLLVAYAAATRQWQLPGAGLLPLTTFVGVLDAGGNAFFTLAAQAGRLDVASVMSSLYPASTVWLAWLILKERLSRPQWAGLVAALTAIVLITL